jgi:hypothetical protein
VRFFHAKPEEVLNKVLDVYNRHEVNELEHSEDVTVSGFFPLSMSIGEVWNVQFAAHHWRLGGRNSSGKIRIIDEYFTLKDVATVFIDSVITNAPGNISIRYYPNGRKEILFDHCTPYQLLEFICVQKKRSVNFPTHRVPLHTVHGSLPLNLSMRNMLFILFGFFNGNYCFTLHDDTLEVDQCLQISN